MKNKNKKGNLKKIIITVFIAMIITGGVYAIVTAPTEKMTSDQKQLEAELSKNAELLNQQSKLSSLTETESDYSSLPVSKTEPDYSDFTTSDTDSTNVISLEKVTFIGDSVMLGAAPQIQNKIPGCVVSAVESRQVWDTADVVKELDAKGDLGDIVVLGVGINGTFSESVGQELLDTVGKDRTVYWINVYGKYIDWQEDVNSMIKTLAEKNENVTVIDWAGAGAENPDWFYDDGIHLKTEGQIGYANFVAKEIGIKPLNVDVIN